MKRKILVDREHGPKLDINPADYLEIMEGASQKKQIPRPND